jgi:hypothetical protein
MRRPRGLPLLAGPWLLVGLWLGACATSYIVPRPASPEAAGVAIDVEIKAPIAIFFAKAQVVYFARLDGGEGLQRGGVVASMMAADGRAYLLNVPAGEYAAVAAAEETNITSAPAAPQGGVTVGYSGTTRSRTFFSEDVIQATRVTVAPGHFAFIGRLFVDSSAGLSGADSTQLHYIALITPGAATSTMGQIFSLGNYQYRGSLGHIDRDEGTLIDMCRRAPQDLADSGWTETFDAPN